MEVILASSSPRRRQILNLIGLKDFKVVPPKGREVKVRKPSDVRKNALLKGESVLKELPKVGKYLVIASDTAVFINGRFLGKPSSPQEAREMLKTLSGNWHTVYTSIGVFLKEGSRVRKKLILDRARVKFKKLSDGEIDWYISTGEPLDKAGAYGIQGYGAIFVEKIVGDYFTVMGMSPNKLYGLLVELLGEGRVLKLLNG